MLKSTRHFWEQNPALLYGLSLLISTSSYLFWELPWNWVFSILWCVYLFWLKRWGPVLILFAALLYCSIFYSSFPEKGEQGYFSISSLQPHQSPFYKGLIYRGTLQLQEGKIPCSIYYHGKDHPPADSDYLVRGKLEKRGKYEYTFKVKEWNSVKNSWSMAEMRYQLKEKFRKFLEKRLTLPRTASFLSSLITGDVEERSLRYEFGRLGLQHILAISGFHFGILIAFCSYLGGLFLPQKWKLSVLCIGIHLYFLFVGPLPAVQRSWLTAESYLVAKFFRWNTTGLNLLGFALTAEILLNPLVSTHIGFQLSFLSCAGILLFYPHFERWLKPLFPQRASQEFTYLSLFSKQASLLVSFLRKGISLAASINLAILPLLLVHFHQFPFLSLFYNLFFPFLVGVSLSALLLSLILYLLFPPLSHPFFWTTDFFTSTLLNLASYPPLALDYSLRIHSFPSWAIPFYLFLLFCLSVKLTNTDRYVKIS